MDEFQVPSIPAIYVDHSKQQNGKQNVSTNQNTKNESESLETTKRELNGILSEDSSQSSQLCSSCSHVLLKYFEPLQQYVNEVVEIARGQQNTAPQPLIFPNHTVSGDSNSSKRDLNHANKVYHSSNEQSDNRQQNYSQSTDNNRQQYSQSTDNNRQQYSKSTDNNRQQYSHSSDSRQYRSNDNDLRQTVSNDNDLRQTVNDNYQNDQQIRSSQILHKNKDNSNNNSNNRRNQVSDSQNEVTQELNIVINEAKSQVEVSEKNQYSNELSRYDNQSQSVNTNFGINERSIDKSIVTKISSTVKKTDKTHDSAIISDVNANQLVRDENKVNKTNEVNSVYYENNESENSQQVLTAQQFNELKQSDKIEDEIRLTPYAFVTTAYNNLSAANAIILANSLLLTNNRSMNYIDDFGNKSIIEIPFVILLGGSIEPSLKDAIYNVFDEVISQPMDIKLALLTDQSFGIQQFKIQLWKELINYKKCIYLESSTMAIGKVTNLFQECDELSACVDWLFPDYFNCSVFVFEPNIITYNDIINFALLDQKIKSSSQREDSLSETLDEMTLLNKFFATKWKRISFIYNFARNDAIYTQLPAFMRFGDTIKIVNFGHMHMSHVNLGNQSNISSLQPWHIMIDLLSSSQTDAITSASIDNYSKFYLNIFFKRLWPLLQPNLTPLLISKFGVGRREWSIFELIRVLSNQSGLETDDHMFTQNPITLRRIKSATESLSQLDNLNIQDTYNISTNEYDNKSIEDEFKLNEEEVDVSQTSDTEPETELEIQAKPPEQIISPEELDERSMREFEAGRIDWMGAHKSDKIIQRLKDIIRND